MLKFLAYLILLYQMTETNFIPTGNWYTLTKEFQTSLRYEAWEYAFGNNDNDTNTTINNFLNTILKTFNASFPPLKKTKLTQNTKAWLTNGIKISYNNKRKLYLLYRESNDPILKKTL
jgi:hypothetical protein